VVWLIGTPCISTALAAGTATVTLTVQQVFTVTGPSAPPSGNFTYRLTAKQASNPMPGSSLFSIIGTGETRIGPISFTRAGVYAYEIRPATLSQPGYTYDQEVYTVEVYVERNMTGTVVVYKSDGSKASGIRYAHAYNLAAEVLPSDPALMVDPPVVKTVSGNPATASVFTFQLTAGNPSNPMPADSANGVKTVQITGSGRAEFGTWSYTGEGIYYYTISEVITGADGYIYDSAVYTITDSVKSAGNQLLLTRVVTNSANRQVTSLSFINTYTGNTGGETTPPTPTPTPPPIVAPPPTATPPPPSPPSGETTPPDDIFNPGGSGAGGAMTPPPSGSGGSSGNGPRTGDDSQIELYAALFCAAAVTALGSAGYLLTGGRRKGGR